MNGKMIFLWKVFFQRPLSKLSLFFSLLLLFGLIINYSNFYIQIPHPIKMSPICNDCLNYEYKSMLYNNELCRKANEFLSLKLLVLIFTIHEHHFERETIRNTWLSLSNGNKSPIMRYVFLLGNIENPELSAMVEKEHELHRDILKHDFIENYYNLTIKTTMGFKWASKWCPGAQFVLKTDDDVYINMPTMFDTLRNNSEILQTSVGGFCITNASVIREENSKYSISFDQYEKETYPGFCSGTGYVTSMAVVQSVLKVHRKVPFFQLEDVFVGMCLDALNYTFTNLHGFKTTLQTYTNWQMFLEIIGLLKSHYCYGKSRDVVLVHSVSAHEISQIWSSICPKGSIR